MICTIGLEGFQGVLALGGALSYKVPSIQYPRTDIFNVDFYPSKLWANSHLDSNSKILSLALNETSRINIRKGLYDMVRVSYI